MDKLYTLTITVLSLLLLPAVNSFTQEDDIWFQIKLRIHAGKSELSQDELDATYDEINKIWAQASIVFEVETVDHDDIMEDGFDMWIEAEKRSYNGIYRGQHDIWTNDEPSLGTAPNPVELNVARTSAHELGHGLNLGHYNDDALPDQRDNVMASGTRGWELKDWQVEDARERAQFDRIGAVVVDVTSMKYAMLNKNKITIDVNYHQGTPQLSIYNPGTHPLKLELVNILGQSLQTLVAGQPGKNLIPVQGPAKGVYLVRALSKEERVVTRLRY